ncbi:MAG: hypothetical protein SOZ89_02810 [Peptoniphilaceae bacterium]|nr:hypothetical protein [Peptoniphilaceae bacterium]MDD7383894.1 hypothetical protein [Peptoniphilaceae bacterium]MDY3738035.1 hypothetical protein [Peptoniphilaceae bacterium]
MKKIFLIIISIFLLTSCRQFNSTTKNGEVEFTEDNTALESGVSDKIDSLATLTYFNSNDGKVYVEVKLKEKKKENYQKVIDKVTSYIKNFNDDEWFYLSIKVDGFKDYETTF